MTANKNTIITRAIVIAEAEVGVTVAVNEVDELVGDGDCFVTGELELGVASEFGDVKMGVKVTVPRLLLYLWS